MPVCTKCHHEAATAEMRRVRNHPGDYSCRDREACSIRQAVARLSVRFGAATVRRVLRGVVNGGAS